MMPDFTRRAWVSSKARDRWEPVIQAASSGFQNLERASVYAGVRQACLQNVGPDGLGRLVEEASGRGATVVTLAKQAVEASYSASGRPAQPGQAFTYRVAVTFEPRRFKAAYDAGNDSVIGELLGFPTCCRLFFGRTWGKGLVDTTAEMLDTREQFLECNILGRWLGVRWVPHLPCSFGCPVTAEFGRAMRQAYRTSPGIVADGLDEAIDEVLSWPCEWTALNGIAEIKWPVLKVSTRTNVYPEKKVVRWEGTRYPEHGARGLVFPYSNKPEEIASRLGRVAASTEVIAGIRDPKDNGFSSVAAMNRSHEMVIEAMKNSPSWASVIDFGCGDGTLLEKVHALGASVVMGVESDKARANKANVPVFTGTIRDWAARGGDYDVGLISARRLEEDPELRDLLRPWLKTLVVYSYDEPTFARIETP